MANLLMRKLGISLLLLCFVVSLVGTLFQPRNVEAATITVNRVIYATTAGQETLMGMNSNYTTAHDATDGIYVSFPYTDVGGQWNLSGYAIFRTYLWFDTSVIPDGANITSLKLELTIIGDSSDTDFNLTVQSGMPTYPHDPLETSDYYYGHYSGNEGMLDTTGISLSSYNVTLANTTLVNVYGLTKFALRSDRDINSIAPSGNEYVGIWNAQSGYNYAPKLYLTYTSQQYRYLLYGAFNENGIRAGAINGTYTNDVEARYSFTLDGNLTIESEAEGGKNIIFNLPDNRSRTIYLYQDFEDVFAFVPAQPVQTYYFEVDDFIGLQWGYLESVINVNGTNRVVERFDVKLPQDLPFTFSQGQSYIMRLVSDRGIYVYGTYTAKETYSFTLAVTSDMFPSMPSGQAGIRISAVRYNDTFVQLIYRDRFTNTSWVNFDIYNYDDETTPVYSINNSASEVTINWNNAAPQNNYYVIVTYSHLTLGIQTSVTALPYVSTGSNPWGGLSLLGPTFPFDIAQAPAVAILIAVGIVFSWYSIPIGLFAMFATASIEVGVLGWLAIGWGWLGGSGVLIFMLILSEAKQREMP